VELTQIDLQAPPHTQAPKLAQACETTGFFRLPLSVISGDVANAAWDAAASFFALPEAEKRAVEFPSPGYPYGYSPFRFESLAKSLDDGTAAGPDLKESLSVGPDCAAAPFGQGDVDQDESWIRSPSLWPAKPIGLQAAWTAYYQSLAEVAEQLLSIMALALDLPADYFVDLTNNPITSMRALHYPAITAATDTSASLRAGAHSDYGTLTILRTDEVAGLQIQDRSGQWVDVKPEPDTFVVNLGDSIAQWTNDRWRSTVHRVVASDPAPRQSFAFFHMANWDATIECLPTCQSDDDPPRHAPVQAGPWLMRKFQSTVS